MTLFGLALALLSTASAGPTGTTSSSAGEATEESDGGEAPASGEAPAGEASPSGEAPPSGEAGDVGDELVVREEAVIQEAPEVARKRAEVYAALKQQGYRKGRDLGDRTVFLPEEPWGPRVIVHDDGWVYLKRQPPRVHAPGRSFADQGHPAEYLLCILAPTSCLSLGGWLVGERKLARQKGEVLDATRDEVRNLNDAVARRELGRRLNEDIPADLDAIWGRADLPPEARRRLLYTYWDTRTEGPEGMAAREAVRAFLVGEVQQSDAPFTAAELDALNAARSSLRPLDLPTPRRGPP